MNLWIKMQAGFPYNNQLTGWSGSAVSYMQAEIYNNLNKKER